MSEEQKEQQVATEEVKELDVSKDESDDTEDEDYKEEETSEESEDDLEYNSHDEGETESEEETELNEKFSKMAVNHKYSTRSRDPKN